MDLVQILGLLGPAVLMIASVAFLLIWMHNRAIVHVIVISVAFGIGAIALAVAHFVVPPGVVLNILLPTILALVSVCLIIWAACRRAQYPVPVAMLGFIGFSGLLLTSWATLALHSLNLQSFLFCLMFASLFATGAYCLWNGALQNTANRFLFWVFTAIAIQLVFAPLTTFYDNAVITSEDFQTSFYWLVFNFVVVVSSIWVAATLLLGCISDVFCANELASD